MTERSATGEDRPASGRAGEFGPDEEEIEAALDATFSPEAKTRRFPQEAFNRLPAWTRAVLGCVFAAAGGYLAHLAAIPLAWLLGALFSSALLSMTGFNLPIPPQVRQLGQTIAGFAVGVFFTPEVGQRVLELGWVMIAGGIASILVSVLLSIPLARFGGCDRKSAFFAMIPGGLAEMAGLAHQFGANVTAVSVSHSLRIVIIVVTVPPALTLFMGGAHTPAAHPPEMSSLLLGVGVLIAILCSIALNRLRVFNAFLLGGLAVGISLGFLVEEPISAPPYARAIAQIAIGGVLGARFHWLTLRKSGARFVPATIASTLLLILANVAIAGAISPFIAFPNAVLASSPGGIAEMALTAEALNLAPPLVVAWHLVRILLIAVLTAPLFKIYDRLS